jgi:hypothetical protein
VLALKPSTRCFCFLRFDVLLAVNDYDYCDVVLSGRALVAFRRYRVHVQDTIIKFTECTALKMEAACSSETLSIYRTI